MNPIVAKKRTINASALTFFGIVMPVFAPTAVLTGGMIYSADAINEAPAHGAFIKRMRPTKAMNPPSTVRKACINFCIG